MFRPYMAIIRVFFLKVSLYKLRCGDLPSDYNSSMPIHRHTRIIIGWEIPHRNLYSETLRGKKNLMMAI